MKLASLIVLLLVSGCSGLAQIGGAEAGKAFCGQLQANNPIATPIPLAARQIMFSAPAGTRAAMCVW